MLRFVDAFPDEAIISAVSRQLGTTVKRLKPNEHVPLAEARRKVWRQVDKLAPDFDPQGGRLQGFLSPKKHPGGFPTYCIFWRKR